MIGQVGVAMIGPLFAASTPTPTPSVPRSTWIDGTGALLVGGGLLLAVLIGAAIVGLALRRSTTRRD